MKKGFDVILLLAGSGTRCHLSINKVFYKINGKSIFKYSLDVFLKSAAEKIIIVYRSEDSSLLKEELQDITSDRIILTKGGNERQDSVYEGMKKVTSEYVLIHDGARPNICLDDVNKVFAEGVLYDAALLAHKASETIKEYKASKVTTLDRDTLWVAETPQALSSKLFKSALEKAQSEMYYGTDDVMLLEKYYDISPKFILSSSYNLKITSQDDIYIFENILKKSHC